MKISLVTLMAAACFAAVPFLAAADEVSPAQPAIPDRVFDLAAFGAVPDGRTSDTAAFQRAVAAVDRAGGGRLVVPAGVYFTGPFDLCSRIDLHLDPKATILFSPDHAAYRIGRNRYRPLLQASDAHDVMISGAGTIDGNGAAWWSEARRVKREARAKGEGKGDSARPHMVVFNGCQRVRVEGVTLTNAPSFNLVPDGCEDVTIERISIFNPPDALNTDGIDPTASRRVLIERCRIDTGDDCVALKAGKREGGPCEDVLVTDCTFLHGHGCSIGSDTLAGVRHVLVRRCSFDGTVSGVRLKSNRGRGGLVEDVTYTDLVMRRVGRAVVISSYYPESAAPKPGQRAEAQARGPDTPVWSHIVIRNLSATDGTKDAGFVMGLPESPVTDLTLDNVAIGAPKGLRLGYVQGAVLRKVAVTAASGPPLIVEDTVAGLRRED